MKKRMIVLVCFAILGLMAFGQTPGSDFPATSGRSRLNLPPLADLIDSALARSASVQYRQLEIELRKSNLQAEKIYWTRNLGVQADTRYGTFDNFTSSSTPQSTTLFSSTNRQFNYGLGLYLKLPLGDILNRKNQVKRASVEVEEAIRLSKAQQEETRQAVIRLYEELLLRQKLLSIRSEALGNARVNAEMVEKEFRNGVIPVSEYVRISDIVSRAASDYEIEKKEFALSKLLLEDITGVFINSIPEN